MADTIRMQQLLSKLDDPRNEYAKKKLATWVEESIPYAIEMEQKGCKRGRDALRVSYICNHLCPNLAHFKRKPSPPRPSYVRRDPEATKKYDNLLLEYEHENTQAFETDEDGNVITPGVHHTSEELRLILDYVEAMV